MIEKKENERISINLRHATDLLLLLYVQKISYNFSIGLNTNEITTYLNKNNGEKTIKTKSVLDILRLLESMGFIKRIIIKGSRFKQNVITEAGIMELYKVFFNKQSDCRAYLSTLDCNNKIGNLKSKRMEIPILSEIMNSILQQE